MYYEEKVIAGELHFRMTPKGKWRRMGAKMLTDMVLRLRKEESLKGERIKE